MKSGRDCRRYKKARRAECTARARAVENRRVGSRIALFVFLCLAMWPFRFKRELLLMRCRSSYFRFHSIPSRQVDFNTIAPDANRRNPAPSRLLRHFFLYSSFSRDPSSLMTRSLYDMVSRDGFPAPFSRNSQYYLREIILSRLFITYYI